VAAFLKYAAYSQLSCGLCGTVALPVPVASLKLDILEEDK